MIKDNWLICPICGNKTRDRIREDTVLENFPLFCPKCKQETIINVQQMNMTVIKAPDAKQENDRPALIKKIGKTTYRMHIYFSTTSTETMSTKSSVC